MFSLLQGTITKFIKQLVILPRRFKQIIMILIDSAILLLAVWLSYCVRFGEFYIPNQQQLILFVMIPAIAIPVFARLGVYRAIIRFSNDQLFKSIVKAMLITTLIWVALAYMGELQYTQGVPRAIPFIFLLIATFTIAASRFAARAFLGQATISRISRDRVAIYGVGNSAMQLISVLKDSPDTLPFAIIDNNKSIQGTVVSGLPVMHGDNLQNLVEDHGISRIIVCSDAVDSKTRKELVAMAQKLNLTIQILPNPGDIFSGKHLISQIRQFDVQDLLGRKKVPPKPELLSIPVTDKVVLITGAGGSIGSELSRQIVKLRPKMLIINDVSEFNLYEIERELRNISTVEVVPELGSITNRTTVNKLFKDRNIETVFHVAAYKHVPMLEQNLIVAVQNNIFGTEMLVNAAKNANVERFTLISTDKAVRPTNIMGATKRWAEVLVRASSLPDTSVDKNATPRKFSAVRFGNVLNSKGSVVPLFHEQIQNGGPLTITDKRMTRYFMSIAEASELIIQASSLSQGGDIFLLDMGKPIAISELARSMVHLAGLSIKDSDHPDGDIEIVEIGKRQGEKLSEELFYFPSECTPTDHPKILRGKSLSEVEALSDDALVKLQEAVDSYDKESVRKILFEFIAAEKNKNR
ncbi:MAG: polysaccharide biosynthesis protein [Rhizobiaceae bacterium]|nr:polysaccharide biosynthesis protein [Rhizobiaceae bacterium]